MVGLMSRCRESCQFLKLSRTIIHNIFVYFGKKVLADSDLYNPIELIGVTSIKCFIPIEVITVPYSKICINVEILKNHGIYMSVEVDIVLFGVRKCTK